MKYVSTRGGESVSLDTALARGIAGDGGLYIARRAAAFRRCGPVCRRFPCRRLPNSCCARFSPVRSCATSCTTSLRKRSIFRYRSPACRAHPAGSTSSSFFTGPTAAFKDFGAGFLAACISRLENGAMPLTILVATSGDTAGAVAAAFNGRPGIQVAVLFPGWTCLTAADPAAYLLGPQRPLAGGQGVIRRLPGTRETGLCR